jgi:hypothetical protein
VSKVSDRSPRLHASFLRRLTEAWRSEGVRFQGVDDLVFTALDIPPPPLDPSTRYLVHPDDRHALSIARGLSATVAMAGSRAAIITPARASASLVVVFPLEPYFPLLERPLCASDAALYFALQTGEEAEQRLRVIAEACALRRIDLVRQFERDYGDVAPLPANEWLLRATFDPEGARRRIASLP